MIEIVWDEKFKRIYKKWSKKHPDLVNPFWVKMELKTPLTSALRATFRAHTIVGSQISLTFIFHGWFR